MFEIFDLAAAELNYLNVVEIVFRYLKPEVVNYANVEDKGVYSLLNFQLQFFNFKHNCFVCYSQYFLHDGRD